MVTDLVPFALLEDPTHDPVGVRADLPAAAELPEENPPRHMGLVEEFYRRFGCHPFDVPVGKPELLDTWAQMTLRAEYNFYAAMWAPARAQFARQGWVHPYRSTRVAFRATPHYDAPREWLNPRLVEGTAYRPVDGNTVYSKNGGPHAPDPDAAAATLAQYAQRPCPPVRAAGRCVFAIRPAVYMERLYIKCITPRAWESEFVDLCFMYAPGLVRIQRRCWQWVIGEKGEHQNRNSDA